MPDLDLTSIIKLVTQGGPPAIIFAVFYGLAMLIREVRSGKVSDTERAQLTRRIAELEARQAVSDARFARIEAELDEALEMNHGMRYQRDQARVRVEFLELTYGVTPRTVWPPEPQASRAALTPAPAPAGAATGSTAPSAAIPALTPEGT